MHQIACMHACLRYMTNGRQERTDYVTADGPWRCWLDSLQSARMHAHAQKQLYFSVTLRVEKNASNVDVDDFSYVLPR